MEKLSKIKLELMMWGLGEDVCKKVMREEKVKKIIN